MRKGKIRFPLKLKDDAPVDTIDELREHFDVKKIIGYYQDGRLLKWLQGRDYDEEAERIEKLDKKKKGTIGVELCRILGAKVEASALASLDAESIKVKNERISRLKQYPDGINAIDKVDCVAFDQKELDKLLKNDVSEIYLCNGKFAIPITKKNKIYIGIGKVEAVIRSKKAVDFDELGISFVNVQFDEAYKELQAEKTTTAAKKARQSPKKTVKKAVGKDETEENCSQKPQKGEGNSQFIAKIGGLALLSEKVKQSGKLIFKFSGTTVKGTILYERDMGIYAEASQRIEIGVVLISPIHLKSGEKFEIINGRTIITVGNVIKLCNDLSATYDSFKLGCRYYNGEGAIKDFKKAKELFQKAADGGSADAMLFLGDMYMLGRGVRKNLQRAIEYYEKSAAGNHPYAMERLGDLYTSNEAIQDYKKAMTWLKKAAEFGCPKAMTSIGDMYDKGLGVSKNYKQAATWYSKGAEAGDASAMCKLGCAYYTGIGIAKDEPEGMKWIQRAADAGDDVAIELIEDFEKKRTVSKSSW